MVNSSDSTDAQVDRYPVAELPTRYGIKTAALYKRFEELNIKPFKFGRMAYLDAEQFAQMESLHEHLQRGGTFSDFPGLQQTSNRNSIETNETAIVSSAVSEHPDRQLVPLVQAIKVLMPTFWAGAEKMMNVVVSPIVALQQTLLGRVDTVLLKLEAIEKVNNEDRWNTVLSKLETIEKVNVDFERLNKSVLPHFEAVKVSLDLLERVADRGILLSTSEIAALLGLSPAAIIIHKTSFVRRGFVFTRRGKEGREAVWEISSPRPRGAT